MTAKYQINSYRIASLWFPQVLIFIVLSLFLFLTQEMWKTIFIATLVAIFTGPFLVLFFNHLKLAKATKIDFKEEEVIISQEGDSHTFTLKDIEEVIEYSSENKPGPGPFWGDVLYWSIKIKERSFKISNLIISKSDFKREFKVPIQHSYKYFPFIKN